MRPFKEILTRRSSSLGVHMSASAGSLRACSCCNVTDLFGAGALPLHSAVGRGYSRDGPLSTALSPVPVPGLSPDPVPGPGLSLDPVPRLSLPRPVVSPLSRVLGRSRRGAIYCKAMSMKVHPITRATRRININEPHRRGSSAATRRGASWCRRAVSG